MKRKIGKSLYVWMKSFVIIMISILALLIILTNWMIRSFSNEIKDLNYSLTSIVQTSVDIRLKDIDNFTSQLELNSINLKVSNCKSLDELEETEIYQFGKQLNDYKMSNAFVEDIFIYYPNLNYVIGNLGSFQSKQYYLLDNNLNYDGYESWLEKIVSQNKKQYYFNEMPSGELALFFSRQLPYEDTNNKKAILIIKINSEEVLRILNEDEVTVPNSLMAIVSEDNRVYTYSGNENKLYLLNSLSKTDYSKSIVKVEDHLGSIRVSNIYGMKYVTFINQKDILNSTYSIRNIAYTSIFLCMIFGIGLFAIMSKRNYRPVANLMNKFQEKLQTNNATFVDEYSIINNKIDHMLADNLKSIEKLGEQREIIEGLFLSNLLSNEERNNSVIFASIQRFNLQFEYSLFQIILVRGDMDLLRLDSKNIISKIVEQVKEMNTELYVIATEYAGDIVLLFNMEHDFTMEKMEKIAMSLQPCIKNLADNTMFIGGIYDTMSHIATSYHQALMIADIKDKPSQGIYIYDANLINVNAYTSQNFGFMVEYEMAMLEGNYDNAQKLIDILFNQYIISDKYSFTSRCKKYAVMNPLIEAMSKIAEEYKEFDKEYYVHQLSSIKENQELLIMMHTIFKDIISFSHKRQVDQKEGIVEKAKEYINHNFENPMIGLYVISDMLGVSNTYLSTIFKKNYNQGISQYINKLRIEKAKKLILNTDYNVKEIAISVGFSSDVTFIRVFKQFENTTPGKFKEN